MIIEEIPNAFFEVCQLAKIGFSILSYKVSAFSKSYYYGMIFIALL